VRNEILRDDFIDSGTKAKANVGARAPKITPRYFIRLLARMNSVINTVLAVLSALDRVFERPRSRERVSGI
jgi:hypothetical protein